MGKEQQTLAMEQTHDFGLMSAHEKILKKQTDNVINLESCNQCDYASSQKAHLRRHLETHSGEKSNKCNQCDFASFLEAI